MLHANLETHTRHLFNEMQFCLSHEITHFINEFHCEHHTKFLKQIQLYSNK
jgi:hypothetical protein